MIDGQNVKKAIIPNKTGLELGSNNIVTSNGPLPIIKIMRPVLNNLSNFLPFWLSFLIISVIYIYKLSSLLLRV